MAIISSTKSLLVICLAVAQCSNAFSPAASFKTRTSTYTSLYASSVEEVQAGILAKADEVRKMTAAMRTADGGSSVDVEAVQAGILAKAEEVKAMTAAMRAADVPKVDVEAVQAGILSKAEEVKAMTAAMRAADVPKVDVEAVQAGILSKAEEVKAMTAAMRAADVPKVDVEAVQAGILSKAEGVRAATEAMRGASSSADIASNVDVDEDDESLADDVVVVEEKEVGRALKVELEVVDPETQKANVEAAVKRMQDDAKAYGSSSMVEAEITQMRARQTQILAGMIKV